jgi:preprotein translocase subunit SecA
MFKDKDYVVKDDEVLIVDEFTGRIMPEEDILMVFIRPLRQKKELR